MMWFLVRAGSRCLIALPRCVNGRFNDYGVQARSGGGGCKVFLGSDV